MCILWICGPSNSGKTTLAGKLSRILKVPVIDADIHRNKDLGWSKKDREASCRDLYYQAVNLLSDNRIVIISAICPYKKLREELRDSWTGIDVAFIQVDHEGAVRREDDASFEDIDGLKFIIYV